MSKKRFRTQFTTSYKGEAGEVNNQESCTIPDDSLTVRQLLINHTRGVATNSKQNEGVFTGDIVVPVYKDLNDEKEHKQQIASDLKKAEEDGKKEIAENKAAREAKTKEKDDTPPATPENPTDPPQNPK